MNSTRNYIKLLFTSLITTNSTKLYKIMFLDQFNAKKYRTRNISFENLLSLIKHEYEKIIGNDKNKLFIEKTKAQDKIERSISSDISSLMLSFTAMFVSIIVFLSSTTTDINIRYPVGELILNFICGVFFLSSFIKIMDTITIRNKKGYNTICLKILSEIEKEYNEENIHINKESNDKPIFKNIKEDSDNSNLWLLGILGILAVLIVWSLIWLWSPNSGFEYEYVKKVEMTFSFTGALIGGMATLIALFITVRQTRKIQQANKIDNIVSKEIDNLKMQIEYSQKTFIHAYEYQIFLDSIDKTVQKILRRTDYLLQRNEDEDSKTSDEYIIDYESIQKQDEILNNLDIEQKVKEIFNAMEIYTKKITIEAASITYEEIYKSIEIMYDLLFENTQLIGEIIHKNEDEDKAGELIKHQNSSINMSLELLNTFQFQIKNYIVDCQNRISELIQSDIY